MDAFYASVEERERPELIGRPVIVGVGADARGVVAAANYEARKYGVHSAMPSAVAVRLCPQAIFIRPRLRFYAEESVALRAIMARYTPLIEPLSLDEAFLDVTRSERAFGAAEAIAVRIKREIRAERGLVASVGVAANKFIAKLASDLDKPDGLVVVEPGAEQAFLDPLPVGCLWGVGRASGEALEAMGIRTIGELRRRARESLRDRFGRQGEHLWRLAHGIDEREVIPDHVAKSISHETTFAHDLAEPAHLRAWLMDLTEQVSHRLRRAGLRASRVFVKIRFSDFRTLSRVKSLAAPTDATAAIWAVARQLLERGLAGGGQAVRLLGVGVSGLAAEASPRQGDLFAERGGAKRGRLDSIVDSVRERYGEDALRRGGGLKR